MTNSVTTPPTPGDDDRRRLSLSSSGGDNHQQSSFNKSNNDQDDDQQSIASESSGESSHFVQGTHNAFSSGDPLPIELALSLPSPQPPIQHPQNPEGGGGMILPCEPITASSRNRSEESKQSFSSQRKKKSHHSQSSINNHHHHHPSRTFRRVQRVSRHAAMTTKQQLWDSNAASIDAALSAVNQWEAGYVALRGLLVGGANQVGGLYHAAKDQATKIEHGLLQPVRDWVLLPTLWGMEKIVSETVGLIQQHHRGVFQQSQALVQSVPVVGESLLAPTLFWTIEFTKRTWDIVQYPIPSKHQVVNTVDAALTATKWALSVAGRESLLYMKRADAIVTRTLSTTRWKVLGSGPYATLDPQSKREVIDHLCDRYFQLSHDGLARYELAAHIRRHNLPLYQDLVLTGVLQERGQELTQDDEWLSTCPVYRSLEVPFLLDHSDNSPASSTGVSSLWFRLPNVNGKKPGSDAQWIPFCRSEMKKLEARYLELVMSSGSYPHDGSDNNNNDNGDANNNTEQKQSAVRQTEHSIRPHEQRLYDTTSAPDVEDTLKTPTKRGRGAPPPNLNNDHNPNYQEGIVSSRHLHHPTIAKWYDPDLSSDVLVDQNRAAVSYVQGCSKCREPITLDQLLKPPVVLQSDLFCKKCLSASSLPAKVTTFASFSPPPLAFVLRPTCWRFHGPGDTVRRGTWFLDTARYGLQPFDDEASGILEDAYLFLKWMSLRQAFQTDEDNAQEGTEAAILTVEVPSPDGALVQFTSLTRATAIQKGLGSAIALFKRRVYRGAWLLDQSLEQLQRDEFTTLEETLQQAVVDHGALGETLVPDTSIRSALTPVPKTPMVTSENRITLYEKQHRDASLAAPPEFLDETMGKYLDDGNQGKVEHLVLVVHGIGEMLRTIDLFGLSIPNLSSIVDCCAFLRKNHAEVQDAHFSHMYPDAGSASGASAGQVEYLPIEWHEAFSILSQRREHPDESLVARQLLRSQMPISSRDHHSQSSSTSVPGHHVMMKDISLRTIPNMREFANDTLLDVLYFMSPEHHDIIIDIVTNEMNIVVDRFRHLTGFSGRLSLVGHSLGSIIAWDILSHQCRIEETKTGLPDVPSHGSIASTISGYFSPATEMSYLYGYAPEITTAQPPGNAVKYGPQQCIPSYHYPQLDFEVDNFFLLGSPVAVFLMIRNQRKPLSEDFFLPGCQRVFNIFHPYDPVAYRLEPCIAPCNAEYEPTIMTHWNGGFRVHYQTKRLWKKFIDTTWKTQQNVVEAFEASMAAMGLIDSAVDGLLDDDMSSSDFSADSRANRVMSGALNQGRRIDYMLQEKEIENANEYVAALAAHSSYWVEKDLSLFIARQICLSKHADIEVSQSWDVTESD